MTPFFKKNDVYNDYLIEEVTPIEEIHVIYYKIRHIPSDATITHLQADDSENLFSLAFPTLPTSDDGLPHILEHTVLCGSKKYPVKDPFFSMTRRSLHTFMNAMTGSDFTCYPASSTIKTDFYNLLSVYIDAVFNPLLLETSFKQEGHRYELDENGTLSHGGIVFNEMKGALSSIDSIAWHTLQRHLFQDTSYKYNSGGEPDAIPSLTYDAFKKYHALHYNPSACIFFFYGDIPLTDHLDYLESNLLKDVTKQPIPKTEPHQERKSIYSYEEIPCGVDGDLEKDTTIALGFLGPKADNQLETAGLFLIDLLLAGSDASPFKKTLQESGLLSTIDSYIDSEMPNIPLIFMAKGCSLTKGKEIESLIHTTLLDIANKGFEEEEVERALHQLEISKLEMQSSSGPYGLSLFFKVALPLLQDRDPVESLSVHSVLDSLRKNLKEKDFLTRCLRKYYIDNTHKVTLSLYPKPEIQKQNDIEEKKQLINKQKRLTSEEKKAIILLSTQLEKKQKMEEDTSLLPMIQWKDIPKETMKYDLLMLQCHNSLYYCHTTFTNNFEYISLHYQIKPSSEKDIHTHSLLALLLTESGTSSLDYIQLNEKIDMYTGGISAFVSSYTVPEDGATYATLNLRGKSLSRNTKEFLSLLSELSSSLVFPVTRVRQLISQVSSHLQNSLQSNAMRYTVYRALSQLSEECYWKEHSFGLSFFKYIQKLSSLDDKGLEEHIESVKLTADTYLHFNSPDIVVTSHNDVFALLENTTLSKGKKRESISPLSIHRENTLDPYLEFTTPVNYTVLGFKVVDLESPDGVYLWLGSFILESCFLLKSIREVGGAYGASATYHPYTGLFHMQSYRDPNLLDTFKAFCTGIEKMKQGSFTDEDVSCSMLELLQTINSPTPPSSRAYTEYSLLRSKRNIAKREHLRESLLSATKEDIVRAFNTHFTNKTEKSWSCFSNEDGATECRVKISQLLNTHN